MKTRRYAPDDILRTFGAGAPPVDVVGIARGMGVEVLPATNVSFDASLESSADHAVIEVNAHHPPVRQRFSIAHELGHLMLHPLGQSFRDTAGAMTANSQERAANRFAAQLLMPSWMLKPLVRTFKSDTKGLARVFQVSELAMSYRIRSLYHL